MLSRVYQLYLYWIAGIGEFYTRRLLVLTRIDDKRSRSARGAYIIRIRVRVYMCARIVYDYGTLGKIYLSDAERDK